jgi:hypothetical protein
MSPSSSTRLRAESDDIILRWSANPSAPVLELPVEIVAGDDSEPVLRAPIQIREDSLVTLVGKNYTVNGIVRFCRADRNSYLITVRTDSISEERFEKVYFRDPGALVVDDFLSEEEEAKILESLQDSSPSSAQDSALTVVPLDFPLPAWCS